MKRLALSLAIGAVAAAGVATADARPAAVHARTFKLTEHAGPFSFVDLPPENGPGRTVSRGDLLILTNPLTARDGSKAGTLHAVCTVTDPRSSLDTAIFHCNGSYLLRRGTLALSATAPIAVAKTFRIAVTGGTGAYAGARGTVISRRGHDPDTRQDTVRLAR
jgi:Dirigent-like protein